MSTAHWSHTGRIRGTARPLFRIVELVHIVEQRIRVAHSGRARRTMTAALNPTREPLL